MRLERIDLKDRDGLRECRLNQLDAPVVLWWDSSRTRVEQFAELAGSLGSLSSHHAPVLDDGRVIEARVTTASGPSRRTAHWKSGRSGWWFDGGLDQRLDLDQRREHQRLEQSAGETWSLDRPDSVHDFWTRYVGTSSRDWTDEAWGVSSVLDDRGEFHSRVDYERWLDEASQLRQRLNDLIAQREQLRSRWEAERHADRERVSELRSAAQRIENELAVVLDRIRVLREQALDVERREVALRTELRDLPEYVEVRREIQREVPKFDLSALEAIDRRMLSWRKAHQRIDKAIEQLRGELTNVNLTGDSRSEASFQRIRRGMFDFEAAAEQILRVSHRMELQWPAGSERRLPSSEELKANCESLYDELHRLYESLNQRHAALVRRAVTLKLRHLRRMQRDLSKHLKALMARRERMVEQLAKAGVPAERLGVRAQQGFCRCAREDGYSGPCQETRESSSISGASSSSSSTSSCDSARYQIVRTSNRERRDQLVELLRHASDELRMLRERIEAEEPVKRELEERRRGLDQQLRLLETSERPSELTRALEGLRVELDAGERRLEQLLELIARYERGTLLRRHPILDRASNWVSRLTRGRWTLLALSTTDSRVTQPLSLLVQSMQGEWSSWENLSFEDRRIIALGLVLAWNAQRGNAFWPTVISRPWVDERSRTIACELIRESAAVGGPIWLVGHADTRAMFTEAADGGRELPSWIRLIVEAPKPEPRPIPAPLVQERRVVVHRVNNRDAEEFPGEFRDQIVTETVVEAGVDWAVESSVEAYSSLDRLEAIDDPEAWISQLLDEEGFETPQRAPEAPARRNQWAEQLLVDEQTLSTSLQRFLASEGLKTWRDLAEAPLEPLQQRQGLVAWTDRVTHWRAVSRLLCQSVVDRIFDARVLAACEIDSASRLQEARAYDLLQRIRQLRDTEEGRRLLASGSDDELTRLCSWVKTLEIARPLHEFGYQDSETLRRSSLDRDSHDSGPSDGSSSDRSWKDRDRDENSGSSDRSSRIDRSGESESDNVRTTLRFDAGRRDSHARERSNRESERDTESRERGSRERGSRETRGSQTRSSERRSERRSSDRARADRSLGSGSLRTSTAEATATRSSRNEERIRFYLELDHVVEAAPSIGPKSAEQMQSLGIVTVADFLRADPDELAEQLGNRRVDGEVVRAWQRQTELVCRIPNLRGHDAQILVACGIETPEELAQYDASTLLEIVEPYAQSSEGQRVLRSAPAPDLKEVGDWIRWSRQTRKLRVA